MRSALRSALRATWLCVSLCSPLGSGCGDDHDRELADSGSGALPSLDGSLRPADAGSPDATSPSGSSLDAARVEAGSSSPAPREAGLDATATGSADATSMEDARSGAEASIADARTGSDAAPASDAGPVIPSECPRTLVGWAAVSGDGVSMTTGGGNAAAQRPKTAAELMTLASDAQPRVIEIAGTFDVPRLDIASNKTLIGIGKDATIRGGLRIRGYDDAPIQNVILRNLRVDGATTSVDNDAVQLYFAHHVWIDHCEIWDGPDGNLDMTHAVNWVTVSWTKVRYTPNYKRPSGESMDHRYASLIGHSDNNASEDDGRLKISFHHNYWAEGVIERMPRVRFGQVHVFNNYFASPMNNYCVRAGRGAHLLIEANHFDHVNSPHEFNNAEDQPTAHITARDNVYDGTTGNQATGGGGAPFTSVPYPVTLDPAANIPALVKACAGPR
jgi:pectate lyase